MPDSPEEKAAKKEHKAEEKVADRKAHPKKYVKVGDRARFLRNAATSWEMGTIKSYDGEFGVAQLDNGDKVGFGCDVPPAWEPA